MRYLKKLIIIPIILMLVVVLAGCEKGNDTDAKSAHKILEEHSVWTANVVLQDFQPSLQATGTLVPRRQTELYSLVSGMIEKLPVDIGDKVAKGQLLFMIRTIDYRLALQQAEANLTRAGVIVRDRKREQDRIQNLFKAGSATQQMHDRSITAYEESEAAFKQALVARDMARQSLADCTMAAPYDSAITARYLEKGEYIERGHKVLEIMDLAVLNAEIEISERHAGKISRGLPVTISFNFREGDVEGKVVAVNPKLDIKSRTFLVKVTVDNKDGDLQAGLFCSAVFKLPLRKDQMSVPAEALSKDAGRSVVWVVEDGKAYPREVKDGGPANGHAWILSGLNPGDVVIIKGAGGLMKGMPVVVKKQD